MPDINEFVNVTGAYRMNPTAGYVKWPFSFKDFGGHRAGEFQNRTFRESVRRENISMREAFEQELADRVTGADERACQDFVNHHILGANAEREPEGDFVRLLALKDDRDLGFNFGGSWIVFWIDQDDLKNKNFSKSFVMMEM